MKKLQRISLIIMGIAIIAVAVFARDLSFSQIVSYSPENPVLAAVFMIVLYALKSMTIVFPVLVLFLATGALFPTPIAYAVTMSGLLVGAYTAYAIGRLFSGQAGEIEDKYPKFKRIMNENPSREKLMNALLRIIGLLPSDAVSVYFGAVHMDFWQFTWTTLVGHAPNALVVTILGGAIKDPESPEFLVSLIATVMLTLGSTVFYIIYEKKTKVRKEEK